jgi:hypothetical protein
MNWADADQGVGLECGSLIPSSPARALTDSSHHPPVVTSFAVAMTRTFSNPLSIFVTKWFMDVISRRSFPIDTSTDCTVVLAEYISMEADAFADATL